MTSNRIPLLAVVSAPLLVIAAVNDGLVGFAGMLLALVVIGLVALTLQSVRRR